MSDEARDAHAHLMAVMARVRDAHAHLLKVAAIRDLRRRQLAESEAWVTEATDALYAAMTEDGD